MMRNEIIFFHKIRKVKNITESTNWVMSRFLADTRKENVYMKIVLQFWTEICNKTIYLNRLKIKR